MDNWDDIRYFLEVARRGNVTSAAKQLGVNHSTVSRRIRALEEKHGVRLFERIPSGYEMTEAASTIYELGLELEAKNQQVSRYLFGHDKRLEGDINLTMPHDVLDYCLIEDLASFREQYPKVKLNLIVSKGIKNLAARESDIAVRLTPTPPEYLVGKKVAKLQHGIYCAQRYIQAFRDNTEKTTPLVVWSYEKQIPDWGRENFKNPEIAMKVDDLYSMHAAVKAGVGVARMPCFLPDLLAEGTVKRLNIEMPPSAWGVWVLSHIDLRHTARVQRCRQFIIGCLEQQKELFEGKKSIFW